MRLSTVVRRRDRMDPSANKKAPTDQHQHNSYSNNNATTHATLLKMLTNC